MTKVKLNMFKSMLSWEREKESKKRRRDSKNLFMQKILDQIIKII